MKLRGVHLFNSTCFTEVPNADSWQTALVSVIVAHQHFEVKPGLVDRHGVTQLLGNGEQVRLARDEIGMDVTIDMIPDIVLLRLSTAAGGDLLPMQDEICHVRK